jgi:hypothetical protein
VVVAGLLDHRERLLIVIKKLDMTLPLLLVGLLDVVTPDGQSLALFGASPRLVAVAVRPSLTVETRGDDAQSSVQTSEP